jgi:hypothetical protein
VGKNHHRPIIPADYGDIVPADYRGSCFDHVLTDPRVGWRPVPDTIHGK